VLDDNWEEEVKEWMLKAGDSEVGYGDNIIVMSVLGMLVVFVELVEWMEEVKDGERSKR
jgi:hypothetical protein